jgi:sugar phosphate isomerase/epimerase
MRPSLIACRTTSYGPYEGLALEHLANLGIRHVEMMAPSSDKVSALRVELDRFGLSASSLHGQCDVSREDVARQIAEQMPIFAALQTRLMFVSVKTERTPLEIAFARLRQAGDVAAEHGVTIMLETHPDLATNAAVARRTMAAVGHPHVRINFDTANLYFYNHGADAVRELREMVPYVAAVHLKDTDGGYRHWCFPALGRGIVDFRGVFDVLDEARFSGPCTLEIEGVEGETKCERLVCDRVAESLGYLRGRGRV